MTKFMTIAAAALVTGTLLSPTAFAATGETAFSPDGLERHCEFVAEAGGYVCETPDAGYSLSELGGPNGKKKLSIQLQNPVLVVVQVKP